jgi:hypothetical protein
LANTVFKLRRSSVAGKVPNTSTLSIGELALNLTDQKLFSSDGSNIFELGSNLTTQYVYSSISVGNSSVNTVINSSSINVQTIIANGSSGTSGYVLYSNGTGTYWASPAAGSIGGSNTQIQFNDSGAVNATAGFTFNKNSNTISIGNSTVNTTSNSVSILPGIMYHNYQTINIDYTIANNYSASMVGPVTVATGKTLTVNSGARFVVI